MGPKDVIRIVFRFNDNVLNDYLKDLSDADLLLRPVPGANHIAWQLGHLISAEAGLSKYIPGATSFELPAGFAEKYTKETSKSDATTGFLTKAEYLDLYRKARAHSMKNLDTIPDADLDKPIDGRIAAIAPNVAAMLALVANHPMMHLGQFAVVRRMLGKPVVI
jgi:hypothetical protein